jgi:hypothetical protein
MIGWWEILKMFWPQILAETVDTVAEEVKKADGRVNPGWYGSINKDGVTFTFKHTAVVVDCTCGRTFVVKYPLGHKITCYRCKSWSYRVGFSQDGKPPIN